VKTTGNFTAVYMAPLMIHHYHHNILMLFECQMNLLATVDESSCSLLKDRHLVKWIRITLIEGVWEEGAERNVST
jgi:hypothetical protein